MLFAVVGVLLASAAAAPSRPPHFVFFLAEYVYTPLRASPHPTAASGSCRCCQCPPRRSLTAAGARSDQGNHDIGFHSANITSPHIDALAKAGRELKRH